MRLEPRSSPRGGAAGDRRLVSPRAALLAGAAVLLALGALVTVGLLQSTSPRAPGGAAARASTAPARAPAALVARVAQAPAGVIAAAGAGDSASFAPSPVAGAGAGPRRVRGKPLVFYLGAEFCPYCAAERWALVDALGRFGTFHRLGLTRSATDDVFPATPTFSFHRARYTSPYLTLQTVEYAGNQRQGSGYAPLETPSALQRTLFGRFDAPPYVPTAGAIPFLYLGGRYVSQGSQVQPGLLAGKTPAQVARAIRLPGSAISTSVVGSANHLTAALCSLTAGHPATACDAPAVRALARR